MKTAKPLSIQPLDSASSTRLQQLEVILTEMRTFVIAVSGGIDSTLLAVIAGRIKQVDMEVLHAVSPAVPAHATARVRHYAVAENWNLTVADAGEFQDERYMRNPLNRCYFCKTHLYSRIASHTSKLIVSGTNLDDMSDFRPGLTAAEQHAVRHPYVEASIPKSIIRRLADHMQLHDLAELPASPCLSSRIQTGTSIRADWLHAIDQVEVEIRDQLKVTTVRCRIQNQAVVIELDDPSLNRIGKQGRALITRVVGTHFADRLDELSVDFAPYRMGSAFVGDRTDVNI